MTLQDYRELMHANEPVTPGRSRPGLTRARVAPAPVATPGVLR